MLIFFELDEINIAIIAIKEAETIIIEIDEKIKFSPRNILATGPGLLPERVRRVLSKSENVLIKLILAGVTTSKVL